MKKIVITMVGITCALVAYSQGTVNFANVGSGGLNDPVLLNDGTTKLSPSTTWVYEIFGAVDAGSTFSLVASNNTASTPFIAAGYFNGGPVQFNGNSAGGSAAFQIFLWNTSAGSTLAAAMSSGLGNMWGESAILTLAATGNPTTTPPGTPVALDGLVNGTPGTPSGNFIELNPVPEPATLALMSLGGASLLLFRRRKA